MHLRHWRRNAVSSVLVTGCRGSGVKWRRRVARESIPDAPRRVPWKPVVSRSESGGGRSILRTTRSK